MLRYSLVMAAMLAVEGAAVGLHIDERSDLACQMTVAEYEQTFLVIQKSSVQTLAALHLEFVDLANKINESEEDW